MSNSSVIKLVSCEHVAQLWADGIRYSMGMFEGKKIDKKTNELI